MTQHYYTATTAGGEQARVEIGWDRPLKGFFLTIRRLPDPASNSDAEDDDADPEEGVIYSDMLETAPSRFALEHYLAILQGHGITLPPEITDALRCDQTMNTGNAIRNWDLELRASGADGRAPAPRM